MGDEDDDDRPTINSRPAEDRTDADGDDDAREGEETSYIDGDDESMLGYRHMADARDLTQIVAMVKRYYAAAFADDGAAACALMLVPYAENVPMDYGKGAGPAYSKGDTCAVVMTKTFVHFHRTFEQPIVITGVRVKGKQAIALIGAKRISASYFSLIREGGNWTVDTMVSSSMP